MDPKKLLNKASNKSTTKKDEKKTIKKCREYFCTSHPNSKNQTSSSSKATIDPKSKVLSNQSLNVSTDSRSEALKNIFKEKELEYLKQKVLKKNEERDSIKKKRKLILEHSTDDEDTSDNGTLNDEDELSNKYAKLNDQEDSNSKINYKRYLSEDDDSVNEYSDDERNKINLKRSLNEDDERDELNLKGNPKKKNASNESEIFSDKDLSNDSSYAEPNEVDLKGADKLELANRLSKVEKVQEEMFKFLKGKFNCSEPAKPLLSRLYPGCEVLVDSDRLKHALDSNSVCAFVSRLVTAVWSVSDLYRTIPSGQNRKNCSNSKPLNKKIRNDLESAAKHYYPKDKKCQTTNFTRAIGNKLSDLQDFFKLIKQGKELDLKESGLTEFDLINFKELDEFKKNPSKFDDLDQEIDKEDN